MVRPLVAVMAAALLAGAPGVALAQGPASGPTDPDVPPDGSLLRFVEEVARALETRAASEQAVGAVRVEVVAGRGIDAAKVERSFLPRLKRRLKDGGALVPTPDAPLAVRITLSEEGSLVWATAFLDGDALLGPATVAVSAPVDRELEATLGASVKPAQTRFVLERLGALPAGALDALLLDIDGDGVDELAVLGVDGLRFFHAGSSRLERVGNVVKLPGDRKWPRVPVGWLARLDATRLWIVTDAGHSSIYDVKSGRFENGPADLVPFRGTGGPQGPLCGALRPGSPLITLPLSTMNGVAVRGPSLPGRVRDVAAVGNSLLFVDEDGQLLSQRAGEPPTSLAGEHVGDRLTIGDLDGDGDPELVTTSPAPPGEPDHLVLRRLDHDVSSSTVVFRSPLSGGSIVAATVGRLDFGPRVEVVLLEEVGKESLAWRLRYAP
jgi:hypothetical protein